MPNTYFTWKRRVQDILLRYKKKILNCSSAACPQQSPLGKAAALRQQTAGVSRHVLPKATRLVSRSLPLQLHAAPTLLLSPQIDRPTPNNLCRAPRPPRRPPPTRPQHEPTPTSVMNHDPIVGAPRGSIASIQEELRS